MGPRYQFMPDFDHQILFYDIFVHFIIIIFI